MRSRDRAVKALVSIALTGVLLIPSATLVHAEEVEPAGYHEYTVTEQEAIDHWYGIARGTYLKEGFCTISRPSTTKVTVSGTTNAHRVCDTVKVGVYLDESTDKGASYGTIGSYYFTENNTSSCHGSKANISVNRNYIYRSRGGHSVTEGSTTEMISTRTDWI